MTTGYVYYHKNIARWLVYYWLDGKRVYVGNRKTEAEAIARWQELKAIENRYLNEAWADIRSNIDKNKRKKKGQ